MKINTCATRNPTPNRAMDYCATYEGYEGGDPCGFGETPELATEDLIESTRCNICGDCHYGERIISCETGDGI